MTCKQRDILHFKPLAKYTSASADAGDVRVCSDVIVLFDKSFCMCSKLDATLHHGLCYWDQVLQVSDISCKHGMHCGYCPGVPPNCKLTDTHYPWCSTAHATHRTLSRHIATRHLSSTSCQFSLLCSNFCHHLPHGMSQPIFRCICLHGKQCWS